MSHLATQEKLIFFLHQSTHSIFAKTHSQCGYVHVIFLDHEGKKKPHSLSDFMFCSSAKVKAWQEGTQSLPLAAITFHLGADGFPDCIAAIWFPSNHIVGQAAQT